MAPHQRLIRLLAGTGATVAFAALVLSVALVAASRSPAASTAPRCFAANVLGRTTQQARVTLLARGCKPGSVKDGRHFLVVKRCKSKRFFGKVYSQSPKNHWLGPRQRLVLRVGSSRALPRMVCR